MEVVNLLFCPFQTELAAPVCLKLQSCMVVFEVTAVTIVVIVHWLVGYLRNVARKRSSVQALDR